MEIPSCWKKFGAFSDRSISRKLLDLVSKLRIAPEGRVPEDSKAEQPVEDVSIARGRQRRPRVRDGVRKPVLSCFTALFIVHGSWCGIQASDEFPVPQQCESSSCTLTRPETSWLSQSISRSQSFLSEHFRNAAAQYISAIDAAHLKCIEGLQLRLHQAQLPSQWVLTMVADWPALMPDSERTLLAALKLQVDMLDAALRKKDPQSAVQLGLKRRMLRVRRERDRVFGDGRDLYLSALMEALQQIRELQKALDADASVPPNHPPMGRTLIEVENSILLQIDDIRKVSQTLSCP